MNHLVPTPSSATPLHRTAEVARNTAETRIQVRVDLDGTGQARLNSGIGFLDHMLDQIARHRMRRGPAHRWPPYRRGHRHYAGPGLCQGDR